MSTLYIDRRNLTLSIHGDALVFHENSTHINTIPLKLLQRICIHGNTTLSASVLGRLGEENIGIVVLSGRKQQASLLMPNYKLDGKRRQTQYAQSQNPDYCRQTAAVWISRKLAAQQQLIQQHAPNHPAHNIIQQIAQQIPFSDGLATLRGLEGAAAAQYFRAWQDILPEQWQFSGRNRRPPRDPVNALLSLGYTLLHFEIVKHIHLSGLDPFVGFYHSTEHGRESLASDLLEPMRPQYDQWLLAEILAQQYSPQDFSTTAQGCRLNKEARLNFYRRYEQQAKTWRPNIYEHIRSLLKSLNPQDPDFDTGRLNTIEEPQDTEEETQA